jgi:hypothetical protein
MAIGTPVSLGFSQIATTGALALASVTVAAGDAIIVAVHVGSASITITGVSDTAGNTYTQSVHLLPATSQHIYLFSCPNASALSGGTITAATSGTTSSQRAMHAVSVSGLATSSLLDKTSTNESASGPVWSTGSTGTLAQAEEIAVAVGYVNASTANTPDSGWTESLDTQISTNRRFVVEYQVVSSTSALNAGGTAGSAAWGAIIATYKGAASGTPATVTAGTAAATASGDTVAIAAGATVSAGTATAAASGDPVTVTILGPPVTVAAGTAAATASGDPVTVSLVGPPVTIVADTASATADGDPVTIAIAGAPVTVTADSAAAAASGDPVTVTIPVPASISHGLVFQLTGLWKPGETTVPLYGQISDPQNGEVVIPLNDSRTASVTVSTHDPVVETLAALIQIPYAVFLKVYYEGELVFWGPMKVRTGNFGASTVRFDAVDMTLRLIKHMLREGDILLGAGTLDATDGRGYLPVSKPGMLALRDAAETVSFPTLGIIEGTNSFTADPNQIIGVTRGDPIYTVWQQITSTLGPDWELEPGDAVAQVYGQLNTFNRQGSNISAAVQFHYGTGRGNLEDLSFVEGEEYTNLVHVLDRDNKVRVTVTNPTALARTGPYIGWEATDFDIQHSSDADAITVLTAHGQDLIDAYSIPLIALSLTLPLDTVDGFHYVIDYGVGDTVGVAGKDGFLELPEAPYRITKVTLKLEDATGAVRPSLEVVADRVPPDETLGTTDPTGP